MDEKVPKDQARDQYYYEHSEELPFGENMSDVEKRVRVHLRGLQRIAKTIQPKIKKRIVIIQTEHGETMDKMLKNVSGDKAKDSARNAEVMEMTIPVKGDEVMVNLMDREGIAKKEIKL